MKATVICLYPKRRLITSVIAVILIAASILTGCSDNTVSSSGSENYSALESQTNTSPEPEQSEEISVESIEKEEPEEVSSETEDVSSQPEESLVESETTSEALVKVPTVIGKTTDQAKETLTSVGLTISIEEKYSDTLKAGTVISQSVKSGTMVEKGVEVKLTVSKGKKPVAEWTETKVNATKYVTVGCYSRKKAVQGSETVKLYNVNDKVTIVATTDTGYAKLKDGTFIHSDYLSDSKVVITTTTAKPAPAPAKEFEWVVKPTYDYDDVSVICEFGIPVGETNLVTNQQCEGNEYWQYYSYDIGKKLDSVFTITKNGKTGLADLQAKVILETMYDIIVSVTWPVNMHILQVGYINEEYSWGDHIYYDEYWIDNNLNAVPPSQGIGSEGMTVYYYDIQTDKIFVERAWVEQYALSESELKNVYAPITSAVAKVTGQSSSGIYDSNPVDTYSFYTDVEGTGKHGLISGGKITVPMEYDGFFPLYDINFTDQFNRIVFYKNKKIYVFDKNGKCYSNGIYDKKDNGNQELYFLNGYLTVCKNGKWGLIDTNGNEVLSCQFEDISSVCDGKAWAKQNGKWGIIKLA